MATSLITQRVFFNSTDISIATSDFRVGTYAMTYTTSDYLYIGSSTPLNNIWMEMSTPAGADIGAPVVQVWYARQWVNVVDVIDQTVGMTVSNRISWALKWDKGWDLELRSSDVTGLETTEVYNRYWLRISWAAGFTAGLGYIGQKFSSDASLQASYPDLLQSSILTGYKAGKTDWNEQHFMAGEAIVKELRKRNIVKDKGQIFDWSLFEEASTHKVANIVYTAFGTAYRDHAIEADKKYMAELNRRVMGIDENMDGKSEFPEASLTQGWMTR